MNNSDVGNFKSMTDSKEKTPVEYYLALSSVKGLGNVQIKKLISDFGSVKAILEAKSAEIEQLASLTPAIAARIGTVTDNLQEFREKVDALHDQKSRYCLLRIQITQHNSKPFLMLPRSSVRSAI